MQNELGILEFIHALVETLDKYFENVCELDIMFNLEKAHFILGGYTCTACDDDLCAPGTSGSVCAHVYRGFILMMIDGAGECVRVICTLIFCQRCVRLTWCVQTKWLQMDASSRRTRLTF